MKPTIRDVLRQAKTTLASIDVEVLLAHVIKKPRSYLLAHPEAILDETQSQQFADCLKRKMAGEPTAYILRHREFWSLDLEVTPDTLIPRPETELLVEWVLKTFEHHPQLKVADLGTGSGAIAIALAKEKPAWQVIATDMSDSALHIARKNAQRFGLQNISFYQGNWCTALPFSGFDVIVSNPPYIAESEWLDYEQGLKYEPTAALLAGKDGMQAIKEIAMTAKSYLKPKGYVIVEHGFLQGNAVRELFSAAGLIRIETVQDMSGHERITGGQNDF